VTEPRGIARRLPEGARDSLPTEAEELRQIESALRRELDAYGYREVATPVLEYADVLEGAIDQGLGDAFRLFDASGRVMVLRPDITVPVSRLVATRLAEHPGPVRAFYFGRAFRPPPPGAPQAAEVRQAGAELVGASGPAADAELIALLHRSLTGAGIGDLTIAVGDIALTEAVLDGLGVPRETRVLLGRALAARNLVEWQRIAAGLPLPAAAGDLLGRLPALRGGPEILERVCAVAPAAESVCDTTGELLDLLGRAGIGADVMLDVGIARDWPYYSGLVLEAHSPLVGAPLAAGGRYDLLAERFGAPRPSVGFAIDLDVLHRALALQGGNGAGSAPGVVLVGGLDAHLELAGRLRGLGVRVAGVAADHPDPSALARADGWARVLVVRDDRLIVSDLDGTRLADCASAEEVVRWLA
jgi:ATP phosphoribosyltransferase regulatory subunit